MAGLFSYLKLVKFSHTIFALPFAMIAFVMAVKMPEAHFSLLLLVKIIVCMVFARNAAMGFNRYADRFFDRLNPRTKVREIPSGVISSKNVLIFTLTNVVLFSLAALSINLLCFILSAPALAVILGYSYTKRFTWMCHYFLGLALSIAPAGAYIAVTGRLDVSIIVLCAIVLFWSSGFDIIYSLSDELFDKENNLHSVPARFGQKGALVISSVGHIIVAALLLIYGKVLGMGYIYMVGAILFSLLLLYQHIIVRPGKLDKVNAAFFTANGLASLLFSVFTIADLLYI